MKILLLIIITYFSSSAFAQGYEYQYPKKVKDPQLEYQLPDKDSVNRTTPEVSMYYIRSGYSVGNIADEFSSFTPGGLGTRRYADEFYYGLDFSTHYGAEGRQAFMTSFQLGHHFLTLRHRIKPYIGVNFGYASLKDTENKNRPSGNGINLGLDFGFQVFKVGPFSTSTGFKFDHAILNNKEVSNLNFYDIYFMFGFGF